MTKPLTATKSTSNVALLDMILATKLYIPPARPNQISRPQLIARLDNALHLEHKLILLSASAGFGKTTLLSEWISNTSTTLNTDLRSNPPPEEIKIQNPKSKIQNQAVWLSLDEDDNNPHRFLAYCVAALQTIQSNVGQTAMDMLQDANLLLLTPEVLVTTLINEATPITAPLIFVLDDYHVITNQLIHDSLAFLLDNMPPHFHLVIASREEPPLPLARLRGRGQLTELGLADLRFTLTEATTFLNQTMGLNLPSAELTALEHRTEGWIAGLQMAAISMQGIQDTEGFVRAFTGSHRYILDYLLEEVLNRQPEQVQRFLLQTSISERLCGPLCDAILHEEANATSLPHFLTDSQAVLEHLEQANLFIMPLDDKRHWYRYHHLFADLLRHRLTQTNLAQKPIDIATLHCRASEWFEQNSFPVEAMSHALEAIDVKRVVRLAKQKAAAMLSRSEFVTLLSWLDILPDALERSQPHLSLLRAWAMVLTNEFQAVEAHLQDAEQAFKISRSDSSKTKRTDILGEIATLRAAMAYFQRDMPTAITLFHQALDHISTDNLFLRGIVMQGLGSAYGWCGNVRDATRIFDEASTLSQNAGNMLVTLIATWNLAGLYEEQGYLHQAAGIHHKALALVDQQTETIQQNLLSFIGRLYVGLAGLLYQWNDIDKANQHVLKGIQLGEQEQESGILANGYLVLAQIKQTQQDNESVQEALQKARQFARRYTGPRYLFTQVAIYQVRLWLRQGSIRAVANWVQEQNLQFNPLPTSIPYLRETEYLVLVRLLMAQSQQQNGEPILPVDSPLTVATNILTHIIKAARESQRTGRVIEALTLHALILHAQNNTKEALPVLQEALLLAEPEGYLRLFVDEGSQLADLLRQAVSQNIAPKYIAKLLPLFGQASASSSLLIDPLSDRELEILQLIATGMSNKELAEKLVVTVGTVKWHLNNIYSKLAVRSRTQAVARARELGLVS